MSEPPSVEIRIARPDDRDGVWPLARDFATSFTPERVAFESLYAQLLGRVDTLLLVAEADQYLVGYLLASGHLTLLANGPVCWVEEVMVAFDHRRLGVGRALMECAERWAGERGAAYISLASRRLLPRNGVRTVCSVLQEDASVIATRTPDRSAARGRRHRA